MGVVGAPFGVKGFVKIHSMSGEIDHLLKLKQVILRHDEKETLVNIEETAASGLVALMRFSGIANPEAAKALAGAELLTDRKNASPLAPGEFYIEDLKGLAVVSALPDNAMSGAVNQQIGFIKDIIEGGNGELAEIKLTSSELRLVPFRKEFFPEIDLEKGRVVMENLWILE